LTNRLGHALPRYLPVAGVTKPDPIRWPANDQPYTAGLDLSALLCTALLTFQLEYEQSSPLSLAISANALRVIDDQGVRVRDVPLRAGISREATSLSVDFLQQHGYVAIDTDSTSIRTKVARLTAKGQHAQQEHRRILADVETQWRGRFGAPLVDAVRESLRGLLSSRLGERPRMSAGLVPYPDGWRAHPPYLAQTNVILLDPVAALPHHPMVSHRGGFPDGS